MNNIVARSMARERPPIAGGSMVSLVTDAALVGDNELAISLCDKNPGLMRVSDDDGLLPIHCAIMGENVALVDYLAKDESTLKWRTKIGDTALHMAVPVGSAMVESLLKHQADPYTKNSNGRTAFDLAADLQKPGVLWVLKNSVARPQAHAAVYEGVMHSWALCLLQSRIRGLFARAYRRRLKAKTVPRLRSRVRAINLARQARRGIQQLENIREEPKDAAQSSATSASRSLFARTREQPKSIGPNSGPVTDFVDMTDPAKAGELPAQTKVIDVYQSDSDAEHSSATTQQAQPVQSADTPSAATMQAQQGYLADSPSVASATPQAQLADTPSAVTSPADQTTSPNTPKDATQSSTPAQKPYFQMGEKEQQLERAKLLRRKNVKGAAIQIHASCSRCVYQRRHWVFKRAISTIQGYARRSNWTPKYSLLRLYLPFIRRADIQLFYREHLLAARLMSRHLATSRAWTWFQTMSRAGTTLQAFARRNRAHTWHKIRRRAAKRAASACYRALLHRKFRAQRSASKCIRAIMCRRTVREHYTAMCALRETTRRQRASKIVQAVCVRTLLHRTFIEQRNGAKAVTAIIIGRAIRRHYTTMLTLRAHVEMRQLVVDLVSKAFRQAIRNRNRVPKASEYHRPPSKLAWKAVAMAGRLARQAVAPTRRSLSPAGYRRSVTPAEGKFIRRSMSPSARSARSIQSRNSISPQRPQPHDDRPIQKAIRPPDHDYESELARRRAAARYKNWKHAKYNVASPKARPQTDVAERSVKASRPTFQAVNFVNQVRNVRDSGAERWTTVRGKTSDTPVRRGKTSETTVRGPPSEMEQVALAFEAFEEDLDYSGWHLGAKLTPFLVAKECRRTYLNLRRDSHSASLIQSAARRQPAQHRLARTLARLRIRLPTPPTPTDTPEPPAMRFALPDVNDTLAAFQTPRAPFSTSPSRPGFAPTPRTLAPLAYSPRVPVLPDTHSVTPRDQSNARLPPLGESNLRQWLTNLGLAEYSPGLEAEKCSILGLSMMSDMDLLLMGVDTKGARATLIAAARRSIDSQGFQSPPPAMVASLEREIADLQRSLKDVEDEVAKMPSPNRQPDPGPSDTRTTVVQTTSPRPPDGMKASPPTKPRAPQQPFRPGGRARAARAPVRGRGAQRPGRMNYRQALKYVEDFATPRLR